MRLLLVEDDLKFKKNVANFLQKNGFAVDCVTTIETAFEQVSVNEYDVILLDINLPDGSGVDFCLQIQPIVLVPTPIIMVTANDDVTSKITTLNGGADDYIIKPFDFEELKARINSVLRRSKGKEQQDLTLGDVTIFPQKIAVTIATEVVTFTVKEFEILYYLVLSYPAVKSLEDIIAHVWNDDMNPFTNTARVHIMNIRKKLAEYSTSVSIKTIKEKGYSLCVQ